MGWDTVIMTLNNNPGNVIRSGGLNRVMLIYVLVIKDTEVWPTGKPTNPRQSLMSSLFPLKMNWVTIRFCQKSNPWLGWNMMILKWQTLSLSWTCVLSLFVLFCQAGYTHKSFFYFYCTFHRSPARAPTLPSRTRTWEVGRFLLTDYPSVCRTTPTHLIKTLSSRLLEQVLPVKFLHPFKVTFVFFLSG